MLTLPGVNRSVWTRSKLKNGKELLEQLTFRLKLICASIKILPFINTKSQKHGTFSLHISLNLQDH